jgi:CRISPR-associated protein Cpf1
VKDESKDKDYDFYNTLEYIIIDYPATKWYDAIRNYLTKKPFSEEKIKLNFDSSTLLAGWDKNQETQNLCVLLKDKEKFYLAIMKKDNNKFFRDSKILYETDG